MECAISCSWGDTEQTAQRSVSVQRRCEVKLSEVGWKGGAVSLISYCTFLALRVCHVVPALTNRNEFLTTTTRSQPIVLLSFVSEAVASGQRKEVETENDEGKN